MLSDNITLYNTDTTSQEFRLRRYLPNGSERITAASTPSNKDSLLIQHTETGAGSKLTLRHLASRRLDITDPDTGQVNSLVVNITLADMVAGGFTLAQKKNLTNQVMDLLWGAIANGGVQASYSDFEAWERGES